MKRRDVITGLLACSLSGAFPLSRKFYAPHMQEDMAFSTGEEGHVDPLNDHENRFVLRPSPEKVLKKAAPLDEEQIHQAKTDVATTAKSVVLSPEKETLKTDNAKVVQQRSNNSVVNKSINFAKDYQDDIFIEGDDQLLLHSVASRLVRLQKTVGYGNFNILSFDHALAFGKRFSQVGEFTEQEKQFIEKVFSFNAEDYGFYGEKVTSKLTDSIKNANVFKVPHTGHYLLKEQSLSYYEKIRNSIGNEIVLTSGVRSNVKQLHLFLAKVIRVNGNLSRASRSLAPPGYSYHGIGDFDVGRKGWGAKNFTDDFAKTNEFKRMQDLGYIAIRYDHGNDLGVRFEPWHVKVV